MIILLFGPPGCGKGTQAAFLVQLLEVPAISTGEMFRAECKEGTELGKQAQAILASGGLVGDEIVNLMVANRIARSDCASGFLLDGYPRTVAQAQFFSKLLKERHLAEPLVLHLDVPVEPLVRRLAARRFCPKCLRIYNLLTLKPAADGVCDLDGTALVTREDDRESVIRDRLRAYQRQTGPVLEWYGGAQVKRVDGGLPPAEVSAAIEAILSHNLASV